MSCLLGYCGTQTALAQAAAGGASIEGESAWGEGDDDAGFAAAKPTQTARPSEPEPDNVASVSPVADLAVFGFLRSDDAFWLERLKHDGVAKLRQSLDVTLRYRRDALRLQLQGHWARDFAYASNSNDTPATRDAYERVALLREAYASWTAGPTDISVGKQILAWGQGDLVSLLDLVNPRDTREPGLADIDDVRLGAWMTRWGVTFSNQRWDFLVVHRAEFGLRSPVFGPFNPLRPLFDAAAASGIRDIRFVDGSAGTNFNSEQLFGRWSAATSAGDIAFYAASLLDPLGVLRALVPDQERPSDLQLVLDHPRYTLLGHSGNVPVGSWLLEWELATSLERSVDLAPAPADARFAQRSVSLLGGMAGVVYTGFDSTRLAVEASRSFVTPDPGTLLFPFDETALGFKGTRHFFHDDLSVDALVVGYGLRFEFGWLARLELDYAASDLWHLGASYITYQPGSHFGFLSGFDTHDRATVTLRHDFSLD